MSATVLGIQYTEIKLGGILTGFSKWFFVASLCVIWAAWEMLKVHSGSQAQYLNFHLTAEIKIVVCGCASLYTYTIMPLFSKLLFLLNIADKALFRNAVLAVMGVMASNHAKSKYGSLSSYISRSKENFSVNISVHQ